MGSSRRPFSFLLAGAGAFAAIVLFACVGDDPVVGAAPPGGNAEGGVPESAAPTDSAVSDTAIPLDGSGDGEVPSSRVVFVSSTDHTGAFGAGVDGFDQLCNDAASASTNATVRGRKFRAWLSTSTASAKARTGAADFKGEYVLSDTTVIAKSGADLLDGTIALAIARDENGAMRRVNPWTGTLPNGEADTTTCGDWLDDAKAGARGSSTETNGRWTNSGTPPVCTQAAPVYCFEAP